MDSKNIIKLKHGERREVTVIFSDMKGFTKLSENLDPEEIDILMNKIFSAFSKVVNKYEGFIEKYIGDALVAVFGAKSIHEDDPARAIYAALEFINEIERLNKEIDNPDINLKFKSGINTGLVTIGKRGEFDVVTGHTLAVASRLENYAKENEIIVAEETKEKCETIFNFSSPISIKLDKTDEVVVAYKVIGIKEISSYSSPFVGRKNIIDVLLKKYLKDTEEILTSFYIYGDAGIGKSRLIYEFSNKIKKFPEFYNQFLYAKANSFSQNDFDIISKMLLNYFEINKDDEYEKVKLKIKKKMEIDEELLKVFYNYVLDNSLILDKNLNKKNQGINDKLLYDTFLTIFINIFEKYKESLYSVIIVIDNAEFIDKKSRDFLRILIEKSNIKPFFILSSRAIRNDLLKIFPGIKLIKLEPLSIKESKLLLQKMVKFKLNDSLLASLLEETKGNPFFIEEYSKFLNKTKNINEIPVSIQNLILSNIDRLDFKYKYVLKICSVFNIPFKKEEIEYLYNKTSNNAIDIYNILEILVRDGYLIKDNSYYKFRQKIIQDTVYNSILNQNKVLLHNLIADLYSQKRSKNIFIILYHLVNGQNYTKAKDFIINYFDHFTIDQMDYLDKVIDNLDNNDYEGKIKLLFIKYTILYNNGRIEDITDIINSIYNIAFKLEKENYFGLFYHLLSSYYFTKFDYQNAHFFGKKAIFYYKKNKTENIDHLSNVQRFTAISCLFINKEEESIKIINEIVNETERQIGLSFYNFYRGLYEEGLDSILSLYKNSKNLPENYKLLVINYIIDFLYEIGDFTRLKDYAYDFINNVVPNYRFYSKIYAYLGISLFYLGDKKNGSGFLQKAEYYSIQLKNNYFKTKVITFLAEGYLLEGNLVKSEEKAKTALNISIVEGDHLQTFELILILILINVKKENFEKVLFYLNEGESYIGLNLITDFKYKAMFFYLKYKYCKDNISNKKHYLKIAYNFLMKKLEKFRSKELKERFLNFRFNKKIIEDYEKENKRG